MKKLLSIVFCAAAVTAFGDPTETQLGGEIGVTEILSKLSNTVVAVSYDDLTGGSGIIVSNFVKTTNLTVNDQLAVFSNGNYEVWTLVQPVEHGPKFWQKNEKQFFVNGDGQLISNSGTEASLISKSVGTGIWLIRQEPTDDKDAAIPFYIYGKPSTTKTITTTAGVWNLVGNPAQSNVTITAAIAQGDNNDEILVPGEQGLVKYLYKATTNGWLRAKDEKDKWGPAPAIEAGTGFWIKTKEAITINWQPAGN